MCLLLLLTVGFDVSIGILPTDLALIIEGVLRVRVADRGTRVGVPMRDKGGILVSLGVFSRVLAVVSFDLPVYVLFNSEKHRMREGHSLGICDLNALPMILHLGQGVHTLLKAIGASEAARVRHLFRHHSAALGRSNYRVIEFLLTFQVSPLTASFTRSAIDRAITPSSCSMTKETSGSYRSAALLIILALVFPFPYVHDLLKYFLQFLVLLLLEGLR